MYNSSSIPVLTNVKVSGNTAIHYGGGMYNSASPAIMTNALVSGNKANEYGGGMFNDNNSSLVLTNVTISGNSIVSYSGGGMYSQSGSSPKYRNTIIWGNGRVTTGNVVTVDNITNAGTYEYSLIEGLNPSGTNNLNGTVPSNNPRFVNPLVFAAAPTSAGDYRIQSGSPIINAGSTGYYSSGTPNLT